MVPVNTPARAMRNARTPYRGLGNPWPYRLFVLTAIKGEFKRHFARSRLGAIWLVLHPLARASIFAVVFSEILVMKIPGVTNAAGYAVYLMAGMSAWSLFNDIVTRITTIFVDYSGLMRKIPVPHYCLPAVACGVAILNHSLLLAATATVFLLSGQTVGLAWLVLIPGMLLLVLFSFGLGMILGVLNVFQRDVGHLTGIALQIWFWLTPIVYVSSALPEKWRWIVDVNPLVPLIRIYQDALLYDVYPQLSDLAMPVSIVIVLCLAALAIFRQASVDIVDSV